MKRATANVATNQVYQLDEVLNDIGDCYQMHSITFRTELIQGRLRITEKCFYVDQEYILLPIKDIKTVIFLDEVIYQYRLGDENQSVSVTSKQKNREMHKKVVFRLLQEFEDEKEYLSPEKKKFLEHRLTGLVFTQLDIYFSMGNVYDEFIAFWTEFRSKASDLYDKMPGITAKMIKMSGKIGYRVASHRLKKKLEAAK